jgi:DNA-binding PadR family transcriptional regulator
MPTFDPTPFLPLREPTFFILLALIPSDKHGYSILKDVENLSEGKVRLSTGTLYEALSRLLEQGLVERVEAVALPGDIEAAVHPGKPRKHYRLSHPGMLVIEAETARLRRLVAAAQQQMQS